MRSPFLCSLGADSEAEKYSVEFLHEVTRRLSVTYASTDSSGIEMCTNAWGAEV